MGKILNLELPSGLDLPADVLRAINERFLRISESLPSIVPATSGGGSVGTASQQQGIAGAVLQGTHAQRAGARAETLAAGQEYWETDRLSTYIVRSVGSSRTWAYESGMFAAPLAARPSDLALYDAGFLFQAVNLGILWRWDGARWNYVSGTIFGLSGDRPALSAGDSGLQFYAIDQLVWYWWTGTDWIQLLPGAQGDGLETPDVPRRYEAEIEDLRRLISALDVAPSPQAVAATVVAAITTQTDVTASRASGVVYRNTGSNARFVTISATLTIGNGLLVFTDPATPPTLVAAQGTNNTAATWNQSFSFWVLPLNYYKVVAVSGINNWIEWQ